MKDWVVAFLAAALLVALVLWCVRVLFYLFWGY